VFESVLLAQLIRFWRFWTLYELTFVAWDKGPAGCALLIDSQFEAIVIASWAIPRPGRQRQIWRLRIFKGHERR